MHILIHGRSKKEKTLDGYISLSNHFNFSWNVSLECIIIHCRSRSSSCCSSQSSGRYETKSKRHPPETVIIENVTSEVRRGFVNVTNWIHRPNHSVTYHLSNDIVIVHLNSTYLIESWLIDSHLTNKISIRLIISSQRIYNDKLTGGLGPDEIVGINWIDIRNVDLLNHYRQ